ncbi:MAG: AEC family transporter [Kangiellaceae bacterium]|nr:AEC family transporter [Kangiellaceae bacterium]
MEFLIILSFVSLGWIVKQNQWLISKHITRVNQYVIFICLPAVALLKIPHLTLSWSLLFPMLMSWMLLPILFVFITFVAHKNNWSRNITGCLMLIACFGNTSFVGFPIITAFYGEQALAYAVVYDQLGTFLSLAVVGNLIIANYSQDKPSDESSNPSVLLKSLLIKVISFPPFIGLIFAFVFGEYYVNSGFENILAIIVTTLVPTTMFLLGAHFEFRLSDRYIKPLACGLVNKMLIAPLIAFLILYGFGQSGLVSKVTFMEAAMPPMVTASILAIHSRLSPELAAASVGYGLFAATLIMPMIYWLSGFL